MPDPFQLPEAVASALLADADDAERGGKLTARQLDIIHDAGWFRMFVPVDAGGLQTALPRALEIEEALASIDGSLGWTVTLCSGAGLFAGFVQPDLRERMFRNPRLCVGGSGAPGGTAEQVPGGYRVSGEWHYATGTPHLTAFSANCRILRDGAALTDSGGNETVRSFLFLPEEVIWYSSWATMGLQATASHSFRMNDCFIPEDRSFLITPAGATIDHPVYKYPFLQFAELTLAANFSGMALAFISVFENALSQRSFPDAKTVVQRAALDDARSRLEQLRIAYHETASASWNEIVAQGCLSECRLRQISTVSRELSNGVRRLVVELFPFAGIAAANPAHRLNRIWRDLFTATQHSLLTYPTTNQA